MPMAGNSTPILLTWLAPLVCDDTCSINVITCVLADHLFSPPDGSKCCQLSLTGGLAWETFLLMERAGIFYLFIYFRACRPLQETSSKEQ